MSIFESVLQLTEDVCVCVFALILEVDAKQYLIKNFKPNTWKIYRDQ